MFKHMNIVSGSLLAVIAASSIGCGQSMKSNAPSEKVAATSTNSTEEIAAVIKKAEKANEEAKVAMDEAQAALLTIQDEGNIKIGLFDKNNAEVGTSGLLTPIITRLRGPFDTVIAKVQLVKAKFNEARQMLLTSLSRLDDQDPAQAALIAEVMKQMAAIDKMEITFRTAMINLAGKLDMALDGLEKIVSGATSFIPGWGWLVNMVLDYVAISDVRDFVLEIKMKLLTL